MRNTVRIFTLALMLPALILAGDLFFSEYIEGSSNNKAIEIYNPTGAAVDLSQYSIKQSNNGSGWGCYTPTGGTATADTRYVLTLSGTLNAGAVYVIYNTQATASAILAVGNLGLTYNGTANGGNGNNVASFNGNDALGLFKNDILIDVIGVPTENPGDNKGWTIAGTANSTYDHTIVRKSTVTTGNTDWAASAGTNTDDSGWEVYAKDTFDKLGSHGTGAVNNYPPISNAGFDKYVMPSSQVILDGSSSSDVDGSIVSYLWTQYSGESVVINNSNQSLANFIAPSNESELSFILTVTDDSSAVKNDTVNIRIATLQVFISEYLEGSAGNNKYIEIFNGSDTETNLKSNGWDIRTSVNGTNLFQNVISSWGTHKILASNGVIVLGNSSATTYTNCDTLSSNVNFNGNDAIALFKDGYLVDIVGVPTSSEEIIANVDLRRKSTITNPNPFFDLTEWDQFADTDVSNLGSHSTNPNAPVVSDIVVSPEFVTSAEEIIVSATLTAVVGTISSATIYYGASGSLINTADMWNETGNTWAGAIPAQTGNSIVEFYISCSDNQSPANSGQSAIQSLVIANSSPETIANIQANATNLKGQMVTIQGIVTIGAGVLASNHTSAYIQDESGRGLNLYDGGTLYADIARGDELTVVGYVDQYFTTVEVTDFVYNKTSSGNDLPDVKSVSVAGANSDDLEGTLIEFSGQVAKKTNYTTATNISVVSGTDTTIARIYYTTGIDTAAIVIGNFYKFKGVGYQYSGTYETLIGYSEDITHLAAIDDETGTKALTFNLSPAYPNPFNPETRISWQLSKNGKYELTVYNMLGQKVEVIGNGYATAGSYAKVWNASNCPSGVYFVQLKAENKVKTQKLLFLK